MLTLKWISVVDHWIYRISSLVTVFVHYVLRMMISFADARLLIDSGGVAINASIRGLFSFLWQTFNHLRGEYFTSSVSRSLPWSIRMKTSVGNQSSSLLWFFQSHQRTYAFSFTARWQQRSAAALRHRVTVMMLTSFPHLPQQRRRRAFFKHIIRSSLQIESQEHLFEKAWSSSIILIPHGFVLVDLESAWGALGPTINANSSSNV
jgi:hypothetical protein